MDLLVVDNDAGFAGKLADDLRGLDHGVTIAADAPAALHSLDRQAHDAVILGWALPGLDGLAMLRQLRAQGMTVPVILLSTRGRTIDKVEALRAGADDYMVRPAETEELDARLLAVVRGRRWRSDGDTIRAGDILVSPGRMQAWRDGVPLDLGVTEFGLLAALARDAGSVVTRIALLRRVWGHDAAPATNILDAYVYRLRARLAMPGRPDPIVTRRGIGYLLRT
ncbi:response regulator transcription factor [Sphingomonas solaris]|uniref:Response regulator transcription factor n=1 Tax=Alterirhizorhabdus solaris TaxID=2529389 RepID=A0A558QTS2_9SPHN|nr:response regulator transcription factor [Sphingomonas solaris]TVV70541.1 response regulator transcription factor [Sphingomonas solaris]